MNNIIQYTPDDGKSDVPFEGDDSYPSTTMTLGGLMAAGAMHQASLHQADETKTVPDNPRVSPFLLSSTSTALYIVSGGSSEPETDLRSFLQSLAVGSSLLANQPGPSSDGQQSNESCGASQSTPQQ